MGEAKRKKRNSGPEAKFAELQATFDRLGIDTSQPGFYDDPAYVQHEQSSPLFTEAYAEWVMLRSRTAEYDARALDIVPRVADLIEARLIRHEWNGGCIAVTGIMTRILDRLGIWNAPISGSAAAYVGHDSRHFAVNDVHDGPGFDTGHMWIMAPPYDIIDLTLHYQRWQGDKFQSHIPNQILATRTELVRPRVRDMVAPEVLHDYGHDPETFPIPRDQKRVLTTFPARRFVWNATDIRYVPAGIRVQDGGLERVNIDENQGVSAQRIWDEDMVPAFGLRG
ncbi:MAG TPA: hypothetical protein VGV17_05665 [Bosea sp. (in: a-proteobacteria)]|jgi:hypothetical protein|uniref:hypothetical protein n=1 Tax=Bosea sp. (in: a-proteobacteria) TaxID=1871050 RepID=UPI002DDCE0D3|nr:hypothetical protein [Bosea sp. (in: a-proteobacteria)]HEV2553227.1 hypothetical protein [Bosea sp. (in: a-proteobacteria)]